MAVPRIFRPPLSANLLPFWGEFHDSKIRLNIAAIRKLTQNLNRAARRRAQDKASSLAQSIAYRSTPTLNLTLR
jgi:hypothetical protein